MAKGEPQLVYLAPEDRRPSDESLAAAAAAGRMAALEELYRRYQAEVIAYLQRLVHDNDVAVDLFQEAFFRAHVNLHRFDLNRAFRPWLYRIATNVGFDWLRRGRRALPPAGPPTEPSVLAVVAGRDLARRVQEVVGELSDDHRTVFILRQYQGLSYAEIAEICGCPEGTARSRMHYALRTLRAKLRFLIEEDDP